jgi:hypothetical protein
LNWLPELPGKVHDKPDKPNRDQDIESRDHVIVRDPPRSDPAPDHDSDVGNEKRDHAEHGQHVEYLFLVHLLRGFTYRREEKNQVSHQQETGQVYQVTGLDEYGGHGSLAMNPEWLQDNDGNDIDQKEGSYENEMQKKVHI